jgi:hypothetical protein
MDWQRYNTLNKTFLILTVLALGVTACNKQADAPKGEGTVCYFNLSASIGGESSSKGVSLGASTASSTFDASDKVYVYIERPGTYPAFGHDGTALTPLTLSNVNGATCDLSGALKFYYDAGNAIPYEPKVNDRVHLLYNQNGNLYIPRMPLFTFGSFYGGAGGASHNDFAEAVMIVSALSGNGTAGYTLTLGKPEDPSDTKVSFRNLQSFFRQRLSFTDKEGNPVTPEISQLRINSASNKIVKSYSPFYSNNSAHYEYRPIVINNPVITDDGDIYFPLMFNEENKNDALIFTVYDNAENVYTVTKNAPSGGFTNGKYYYGGAALAWHHNKRPMVTGSVDDNPVDMTISGYSEDYYFELSHGGTVTLDNVTATVSESGQPFVSVYVDPAEGLEIVLTDNSSITCNASDAIRAEGDCHLKLSCTGSSATLTVTVRSSSAASIPASAGFIVTCSDVTNNGDGTYTWTYTVTRCT